MNRARIALFLHLDRVTWETGRWSLTFVAARVAGPPAIRRRVDHCYPGSAGSHPEFDSENHPELQFDEKHRAKFRGWVSGTISARVVTAS
jgi:hypothetical protein